MTYEPLTPESIRATREWFMRNALACIHDAVTGVSRVNDLQAYVLWCAERYDAAHAGEADHTFTFWQRAYALQTGVCVPLLPK